MQLASYFKSKPRSGGESPGSMPRHGPGRRRRHVGAGAGGEVEERGPRAGPGLGGQDAALLAAPTARQPAHQQGPHMLLHVSA